MQYVGHEVSRLVEALRFKPEGCRFDGVVGICHNPSGPTVALGSNQPLTNKSTRNISWGKGGLCVELTTLPPSCAECLKSGRHNHLEPSGSVQRLLYLCFT
jgi:hypothetical protein